MLNELIAFLKSRTFLFNLLGIVLLFFTLIFGVRAYLDSYTLHGETLTVPDVKGGNFEEASELLEERDLNAILKDSLHSEKDAEPGEVIQQLPDQGKKVKKGRNIYLTIQAEGSELVTVPELTDKSKRQALSILKTVGLEVEDFEFEPDICSGCVLEQRYKGKRIEKGEQIPKDSKLTLVLGSGKEDEKTRIPDLIGSTIEEAKTRSVDAMVTLGNLTYEEGCCPTKEDSMNAKVHRQSPSPFDKERIPTGSTIDLWLTTDQERVDSAKVDTNLAPEGERIEP